MDTINGGKIVGSVEMPAPGKGFRQGRVIIVERPIRATRMKFVTARHYEQDTSWDGGNYFEDRDEAMRDFFARAQGAWR